MDPAGIGPSLPSGTPRLLLATDLSPTSGPATNEAFEVAGRLRAELLIISVIDTAALRLPGGRFLARVDQVRERRQAAAQELVQRGRREGVPVTFLVWEGDRENPSSKPPRRSRST